MASLFRWEAGDAYEVEIVDSIIWQNIRTSHGTHVLTLCQSLSVFAIAMILGPAAVAQQSVDATPTSGILVEPGEPGASGDKPILAAGDSVEATESDSQAQLMWKLGTTAVVIVILCLVLVPGLVGAVKTGSIAVSVRPDESKLISRTYDAPSVGFWLASGQFIVYLLFALFVLYWTWFHSD